MDTGGAIAVYCVADLLIKEALRKNWHRGCFVAYSVWVTELSLTELNVIPLNVTEGIWGCMINARAPRLEFDFAMDLFDLPVSIFQPPELVK